MTNQLTYTEIEQRIEELKKEIEYENRRLNVYGYGKSDLLHLESLQYELKMLQNQIDEME